MYDDDLALVDWVCLGRRDDHTSFECQIMDWADEVAYSVHDVEDGMWAELIALPRLHEEGSLVAVQAAVPDAGPKEIEAVASQLEPVLQVSGNRQRKAALKTWSSWAIYELVHAATAEHCPEPARGPRYAQRLCIEPRLVTKSRILKALAEELVFRHPRVAAVQPRAVRIVGGLFEALTARADLIPEDYDAPDKRRAACDYISGMTDDYAERVYAQVNRP